MQIKIFANQEEASNEAYQIFKTELTQGSEVFGLATGGTPEKLYNLLTTDGEVDFSNTVSVNLDEYVGLNNDHPQSYHYFMNDKLFQYKPFKASYVPNGAEADAAKAIAEYDKILVEYPRDLQLLGLGNNGHIAFNEPGTDFDATMVKVDLTDSTIQANRRFFDEGEAVPSQAYSMGIKAILDAKTVLILAFGEGKAAAVKAMVEGPVTNHLPASALQNHENVIVLLDEASASLLSVAVK